LFWKTQPRNIELAISPFENYVTKKLIPEAREKSEIIISTASKMFPKNMGIKTLESLLLSYGCDQVRIAAMVFANSIFETNQTKLTDAEYGYCLLASSFCLASTLVDAETTAELVFSALFKSLQSDAQYLLFSPKSELNELCENGWDHHLKIHDSPDAILPRAHLWTLARVIRLRQLGESLPYLRHDAMISPSSILFTNLEVGFSDAASKALNNWVSLAIKVQMLAEENELEFWQDW
jgi:hypothetical protein